MKAPQVDVSYHDLSSLHDIRALASKDKVAAVRQAAQQFESVFMGMLMSSMRKANQTFEEDNPLNSQATGFYRDMYDNQLTAELSKQGTLGLAELMVQQLAPEAAQSKAAALVTAPNRFSVQLEKSLPLTKETQGIAFAAKAPLQLDAERIVYPAQPAKPAATAVTVIQGNSHAEADPVSPPSQSAAFRQLGAETLIMPINTQTKAHTVEAVDTLHLVEEPKLVQQPAITDELAGMTGAEAAFVRKILPAARQAARQLGLEPLALVAQAALETGWGQRMFKAADGRESFNLFGIKAQQQWQGEVAVVDTLEYRYGVAKPEKARFRVYQDLQASLQDYVDFIRQQPRYQDAVAVSHDTASYFQKLQAAGYATDPNYAQKILQIMNGSVLKQVRNLLTDSAQTAQ